MTVVLELRQADRIEIDSARLELLFRQMGDAAAEAYVMDAVEEISDRLFEIEWQHRHGVMEEVVPRARRVARLCGDIGLISLGRVARDLGISAGKGDMVAYHAIWERLVRIGDRSLSLVWEQPGLSM